MITLRKAGPGILFLNLFAQDGKKLSFHGEGIKLICADDRYLSWFANSKSSFQRSGICTNPHLSLRQLTNLLLRGTTERGASIFICLSKQVCGSMQKHAWDVIQIMLHFQSSCYFSGATTGLQHARGHQWVQPPPCTNYLYGVGRVLGTICEQMSANFWAVLKRSSPVLPSLHLHSPRFCIPEWFSFINYENNWINKY